MSGVRTIRRGAAIIAAALLVAGGAAAADPPVHEIQVTASRFAFDPPTIQVNAGEPVRIVIRSKDGVHGFAIQKLKIDVQVPKGGAPAFAEFTAPAAGRYEIECSELCGSGHGRMKATLISVAATRTSR